jgi:hypothetical protein
MLVCSVSLRPTRAGIAADIAEIALAADTSTIGQVVFATLVDDPASVGDLVDAFLGEVMLEAASADTILDGSIPGIYTADLVEAATAADNPDAAAAPTTATWDSATATAVTFSGGNLVATNTGTTSTDQGAHVAAASGKTTGKYYFEVTLTNYAGGAGVGVGVGTTASIYSDMSQFSMHGDMIFAKGHNGSGPLWTDNSNSGFTLGARSSGDVIGIAVDLNARLICTRVSPAGAWNGSSSVPGTSGLPIPAGTIVPFVTFGSSFSGAAGVAGNVWTANFGASGFIGAVPSGFTAGWPA